MKEKMSEQIRMKIKEKTDEIMKALKNETDEEK
jgi:hypothetical protein